MSIRTRDPVYDYCGFARRIASRFPVDEVAVSDIEHSPVVGLDFGIELGHFLRHATQASLTPIANRAMPAIVR